MEIKSNHKEGASLSLSELHEINLGLKLFVSSTDLARLVADSSFKLFQCFPGFFDVRKTARLIPDSRTQLSVSIGDYLLFKVTIQ